MQDLRRGSGRVTGRRGYPRQAIGSRRGERRRTLHRLYRGGRRSHRRSRRPRGRGRTARTSVGWAATTALRYSQRRARIIRRRVHRLAERPERHDEGKRNAQQRNSPGLGKSHSRLSHFDFSHRLGRWTTGQLPQLPSPNRSNASSRGPPCSDQRVFWPTRAGLPPSSIAQYRIAYADAKRRQKAAKQPVSKSSQAGTAHPIAAYFGVSTSPEVNQAAKTQLNMNTVFHTNNMPALSLSISCTAFAHLVCFVVQFYYIFDFSSNTVTTRNVSRFPGLPA